MNLASATFQTFTNRSAAQLAKVWPSGEKSRPKTVSLCGSLNWCSASRSRAARQGLAVRREIQAEDRIAVRLLEAEHQLAVLHVPDFDLAAAGGLAAAAGQPLAV